MRLYTEYYLKYLGTGAEIGESTHPDWGSVDYLLVYISYYILILMSVDSLFHINKHKITDFTNISLTALWSALDAISFTCRA